MKIKLIFFSLLAAGFGVSCSPGKATAVPTPPAAELVVAETLSAITDAVPTPALPAPATLEPTITSAPPATAALAPVASPAAVAAPASAVAASANAVAAPAVNAGPAAVPTTASAVAAPAAAAPAAVPRAATPAVAAPASPSLAPVPAAAAAAAPATAAAPAVPAAAAAGKTAPDRLGELVEYRGILALRRGETEIPSAAIDLGMDIRPFDVLATGAKSAATVDLNSAFSGGSTIRMSELTSFWFDVGDLSAAGGATDLRLLTGAIALKVARLGNTGRVSVSIESTSFGVRGTEFIVTVAPEGSVLVTCATGKVECADGARVVFAAPGQAVERPAGGQLAGRAVATDALGSFRTAWFQERTDAFLADPDRYASPYLAQAAARGPELAEAARGLRAQAAIWKKWSDSLAAGRKPSFVELGKDKPKVNPAMFAAAQALFFYEPAHYRIQDMAARLKAAGKVGASPSLDAAAAGLRSREADLAYVRRIFALYGEVSDGSPLGDFFLERAGGDSWNLGD